jgi:hypothetical protein
MSRDKSQAPKTFEIHYTTSLDSPLMSYKMGCFGSCMGILGHRIMEASRVGRFPRLVTQGLVVLIFKGGEKEDLNNWRPITLLSVTYKIFAKALQC